MMGHYIAISRPSISHGLTAILINLGTPTAAQVEAMRLAAAAAQKAGKPWVLDPIAAGGLPWRGQAAAELLKFKPAVVRDPA